ncbi:class I SAM-dependent methyltransferase [Deferrisoma camini]|uniref:class I SAM-dependent methyltransferase n=1 Tax=Deferrisoma camini TaxID=1035120 RepID=UPI00046D1B79|nr:class I SAM-dependent methyltransferase [Deferrisoma camini]
MTRDETLILEINRLWAPVYPHMARYLLGRCGGRPGRLLDLGPFAGGIAVEALRQRDGLEAVVYDESPAVPGWAGDLARTAGVADRLEARVGPLEPLALEDRSFDAVVVRGAFFFLTPGLLAEVARVLAEGGFGWVGGGYGPDTPEEVIRPIADVSRELNARLGKRWVSADEARTLVREAGLADRARVVERGGLWIEVRG